MNIKKIELESTIYDIVDDGAYRKTGGNVSGDVDVDGDLTFNIERQGYDSGITIHSSMNSSNTNSILTLSGYSDSVQPEDIVDLGLPSGTLWANKNIGANSPEETGKYFQWGDTTGHYISEGYDFNQTNYETKGLDLLTEIDLSHDAAIVNCGNMWRIPTAEQIKELIDNCTKTTETVDNKTVVKLTSNIQGYTSNSIYFPLSGHCEGTETVNKEQLTSELTWTLTKYDNDETYDDKYLTIRSLENNNTISIEDSWKNNTISSSWVMSISIDNGNNWTDITINTNSSATLAVLNFGDELMLKRNIRNWNEYGSEHFVTFQSTLNFEVFGNIRSFDLGDDFFNYQHIYTNVMKLNAFAGLFKDCTHLTNAKNLVLFTYTNPNDNNSGYQCYKQMFKNCTSLIYPPLKISGNSASFYCLEMFSGCILLIEAPELPTTILKNNCYYGMFRGCTSLTVAPELPATTLVDGCYGSMFYNCTSLNYIKCFATNPGGRYAGGWLTNVSQYGTFIKDPSVSSWPEGNGGIPENWTVIDDSGSSDFAMCLKNIQSSNLYVARNYRINGLQIRPVYSPVESTNYPILRNIHSPINNNDATTKKYVDDKVKDVIIEYLVALDSNGAVDTYASDLTYANIEPHLTDRLSEVYLSVIWETYSMRFLAHLVQTRDVNNGPIIFIGTYIGHDSKLRAATFSLTSNDVLTVIHQFVETWDNKVQSVSVNSANTLTYPSTKAVFDEFLRKPVTIWETTGTGLLSSDQDISENMTWQLTGLDMTPYKRVKIYTKAGRKASGATVSASNTPAVVLEMSLDNRAAGPTGGHFMGSVVGQKPNDTNRFFTVTCAISADKTSFAVLRMSTLYGTAATANSDCNGYVFKIEGYYD